MQEQNLLEKPQQSADTPAPVENEADAPQEQQEQTQEAPDSPEDISEATGMGWVPKDRFKGNPDLWRPAGEFVRRGREVLPIVQKTNRDLREKLSASDRKIADLEKSFDDRARRMEAMANIALEKQRDRMMADFEAAKRAAVAEGDLDRYDRIAQRQHEAVAEFDPDRKSVV